MKARISDKSSIFLQVNTLFSQYLKFIDYPQIPFPKDVKITTIDLLSPEFNNESYVSSGTVKVIDDKEYKFEFTIDKTILESALYNIDNHRSTIYHEFTHIMDSTIINQVDNYSDFFHKFNNISEIRASYIEYLVSTGSKSIFDFNIPTDYKIIKCSFNSLPSPIEQLSIQYQDYLLNTISKEHHKDGFYSYIIKELFYYIGFSRCIENKLHSKINHSKLLTPLLNCFGKYINDIFSLGYKVNLDFTDTDIELIDSFNDAYNKCLDYYINNYIKVKRDKEITSIQQMQHYTELLEKKEITSEEYDEIKKKFTPF